MTEIPRTPEETPEEWADDPTHPWECPSCGADCSGIFLREPWFAPIGGVAPWDGFSNAGTQTCDACGNTWHFEGDN